MRRITYTFAVLATAFLLNPVSADDDFAALLADLSFGDVELMDETLAVTSAQPAGDLKPAPALLDTAAEQAVPSGVSLQNPVAADQPNSNEQLDLEAAFAVQERDGVQVQSVGHSHNHQYQCDCAANGCESCGNYGHHGHGHSYGYECIPHEMPRLPGMTFYQAFRSNRCNVHVWDNYRQKCCGAKSHIHRSYGCNEQGSSWGCSCSDLFGHSRSSCGGDCCDTDCDACDTGCN